VLLTSSLGWCGVAGTGRSVDVNRNAGTVAANDRPQLPRKREPTGWVAFASAQAKWKFSEINLTVR
jgi:hypothetical protein